MTTIFYVRHGQTDMNVEMLWAGNSNAKLTETGKKQASDTAEDLKDVKIDVAFVSPLQRAQDTFSFINKYHNLVPYIDPRIRERSFGKLEGFSCIEPSVLEKLKIDDPQEFIRVSELAKKNGLSKVSRKDMYNWNENSDFGYNVEKIQDCQDRINDFLDDILKKYIGKNILVVAHGAVGRNFEVYFKGLPTDGIIEHGPKNAEIRIYKK